MARDFDGLDDKIETSDSVACPTAITFLAWIHLDATAYEAIFAWAPDDAGANGTQFTVKSNVLRLRVRSGNGAQDRIVDSTSTISTGVWTHVATTQTGPTATPIFYKNAMDAGASIINNESPSRVAGYKKIARECIQKDFADGRMAEVLAYNAVLTQIEVEAAMYGRPPLDSRLVFYAPLWGVASPEPDLSGNWHNGTVTGAVAAAHAPIGQYVPPRVWGPSGTFVSTEYINVTDNAVGTDTILSIQEWLTVTDSGAGTDVAYLQGEIQIDGVTPPHVQRIKVSEPTVMSSRPVPGALPTRTYLGKLGRTVEIEGWTDSLSTLNWLKTLADGAAHDIQLPTGARISVHILEATPRRSAEGYTIRDYVIRAVERMD